jgi:hypothetical protein
VHETGALLDDFGCFEYAEPVATAGVVFGVFGVSVGPCRLGLILLTVGPWASFVVAVLPAVAGTGLSKSLVDRKPASIA